MLSPPKTGLRSQSSLHFNVPRVSVLWAELVWAASQHSAPFSSEIISWIISPEVQHAVTATTPFLSYCITASFLERKKVKNKSKKPCIEQPGLILLCEIPDSAKLPSAGWANLSHCWNLSSSAPLGANILLFTAKGWAPWAFHPAPAPYIDAGLLPPLLLKQIHHPTKVPCVVHN